MEQGTLIYCNFGDARAIAVIMRIHAGLGLAKRRYTMKAVKTDDASLMMWAGKLEVEGEDAIRPFAIALLRQGSGLDDFPAARAYLPKDRLQLVSDSRSRHGGKNGLVRFFAGQSNSAHIRREERLALPKGYERAVAVQVIDSFIVHRYLRRPHELRPLRRRKRSERPYLAEAST